MKKRLLASLMCLCLLVGLLPATALAAGVTDCPGDEAWRRRKHRMESHLSLSRSRLLRQTVIRSGQV